LAAILLEEGWLDAILGDFVLEEFDFAVDLWGLDA
jgi:hypothetical protein